MEDIEKTLCQLLPEINRFGVCCFRGQRGKMGGQ